jgi:hypothetical protein
VSDVKVVFVAATSPLTVRETTGSTPLPARPDPNSSYAPAVNDPVLAVFAHGTYYLLRRA